MANNSTYCPLEFDEFFKQRRRWIPSTLANQVLLLQEWKTVRHFNNGISFLFMVYQGLLLFSSLINPAVSILVIVGKIDLNFLIKRRITSRCKPEHTSTAIR